MDGSRIRLPFFFSNPHLEARMTHPIVIGVCGGSGAGKTQLLSDLCPLLSNVAIIATDDYYHDLKAMKSLEGPKSATHSQEPNFDRIEAIDADLLSEHLQQLRHGDSVQSPQYDFTRHERLPKTRTVLSAPWIFVEGIFVLAIPAIREQLDLSVFIAADSNTRLQRRLKRDAASRERRSDAILQQWDRTVRPFHEQVVQPSSEYADLVVQTKDFSRLARLLGLLKCP